MAEKRSLPPAFKNDEYEVGGAVGTMDRDFRLWVWFYFPIVIGIGIGLWVVGLSLWFFFPFWFASSLFYRRPLVVFVSVLVVIFDCGSGCRFGCRSAL